MLPFQEFCCITILILWLSFWRLCLFKPTLWHVQSPNICHAESPAGRVQCFKMAEIDPVSPFCLTLWFTKKQFCNVETYKKYKKQGPYTFTAGLPWKFMNFDGVLQRLPSITQANSLVCFKGMFKMKGIWSYSVYTTSHVKYCLWKSVLNLSFCYPEKLSLIIALFQCDEPRYCPESFF